MIEEIGLQLLVVAAGITLFAGVIKGAVGFAMPMIMISGIGSVLPAETALAMLILPTVVTNVTQALRQGPVAAWESACRFRYFLVIGGIFLVLGAQLVPRVSPRALYLLIGLPVTVFALVQFFGARFHVAKTGRKWVETTVAAVAGFIGGMSGVWGPPTVAWLTAIGTPKEEHVRVQGTIYGLGAVALLLVHLQTGVITVRTLPLSLMMVVPALIGMGLGFMIHDRLDQAKFRRATLLVLVLAGVNLVRRGMIG